MLLSGSVGAWTLNTTFLLNSYTTWISVTPTSRPNLPQPGKDSSNDDSSCDQCKSGRSGLGQEHLPPFCLGPLNSTGQQTKLAKMQGNKGQHGMYSKGLTARPHVSVPPAALSLPIPAIGWWDHLAPSRIRERSIYQGESNRRWKWN